MRDRRARWGEHENDSPNSWLEHNVRRSIAVRRLQPVTDLPLRREIEPLDGHRRTAHVAGEPFQLLPLLGFYANPRMQREPRVLCYALPRLVLSRRAYGGADLPLARSTGGMSAGRERALRDPAILDDDGRLYLYYTVAGELGIAVARVQLGAGGEEP
jgi:hypothetical protein